MKNFHCSVFALAGLLLVAQSFRSIGQDSSLDGVSGSRSEEKRQSRAATQATNVKFSEGYFDAVVESFLKLEKFDRSSRILIFINRDLINTKAGLRLEEKTEIIASGPAKVDVQANATQNSPVDKSVSTASVNSGSFTNVGVVQLNKFKAGSENEQSIGSRRVERDIERFFSKELRRAGLKLVDQKIASQLIKEDPDKASGPTQSNNSVDKERQAIDRFADMVIEIIVSEQRYEDREVSGAVTVFSVPEIGATAVEVKTSQIIGQGSSADIFHDASITKLRTIDLKEAARAAAIALLADIVETNR